MSDLEPITGTHAQNTSFTWGHLCDFRHPLGSHGCVCVCVSMGIYVCVQICHCVCWERETEFVFLSLPYFIFCFLREGRSLKLELADLSWPASPGPCCCLLRPPGPQAHTSLPVSGFFPSICLLFIFGNVDAGDFVPGPLEQALH